MITCKEVMNVLEEYCPLSLSEAFKRLGHYDNSGLIVDTGNLSDSVYFMLDLSKEGVRKAKSKKCKIIVTHHPAIYKPIASLSVEDPGTASVIMAIENRISVISMHLNLDSADGGIDDGLCCGLSGGKYKNLRILEKVDDLHGYGREYEIESESLKLFLKRVKSTFETNKIIYYGDGSAVTKIASFCGGGAGDAEKYDGDADLIVTSDVAHHNVKNILDKGKNLLIIPHYAAENYGFKRFYENIREALKGATAYFYEDKRLK